MTHEQALEAASCKTFLGLDWSARSGALVHMSLTQVFSSVCSHQCTCNKHFFAISYLLDASHDTTRWEFPVFIVRVIVGCWQ